MGSSIELSTSIFCGSYVANFLKLGTCILMVYATTRSYERPKKDMCNDGVRLHTYNIDIILKIILECNWEDLSKILGEKMEYSLRHLVIVACHMWLWNLNYRFSWCTITYHIR